MKNQYGIVNILDALVTAVDAARIAAADQPRWINAINSGYDWLMQQDVIEYDASTNTLVFHSEDSGNTYNVNDTCVCRAAQRGLACRHRAAARLVRRALEISRANVVTKIVAARGEAQRLIDECF